MLNNNYGVGVYLHALSCVQQSQLAVSPGTLDHNVSAVHQSALANQMNQMHISGSQYVTSPVHGSFPQSSWQVVQHSAGQGQHHPHQHYVGMEVQLFRLVSFATDFVL